MSEPTDHESILLLTQKVQNIKEGQDSFHQEVRASFKELKDGYANRLDTLETRTDALEKKNMWFAGALATIGIVSTLVIYIYLTQQDIQNSKIEALDKIIIK